MPNILSEKKYTLGKWGLRAAFNQNSLMQLFNGDRRIVQCLTFSVTFANYKHRILDKPLAAQPLNE